MTPILFPLITTLALTACAIGAARLPEGAPPGICNLTIDRAGGLVSLAATARSATATTAHWGLSVTTPDGAALIDQGGDAVLPAGQNVTLSQIALTAPAGLSASLTLTTAGRTVTCPVSN
jgi:hypothetical protein